MTVANEFSELELNKVKDEDPPILLKISEIGLTL